MEDWRRILSLTHQAPYSVRRCVGVWQIPAPMVVLESVEGAGYGRRLMASASLCQANQR